MDGKGIRIPIHIYDPSMAKAYMLGGFAIFTVSSIKTGKFYTYKVIRYKKNSRVYFVGVLTEGNKYRYVCSIIDGKLFKHKSTSPSVPIDSMHVRIFAWVYGALNKTTIEMPKGLLFYHHGHCCCCGRRITDPKSINSGVGPVCAKTFNK
jgi:hypothetical protein